MSGGWSSVLAELVPLGLVVALSPLSIIPAVLVLHTPRPKPTALAYLAGWFLGLAAVAAIFVELSVFVGDLEKTPTWASWVRIVLGLALVVFGIYQWLRRATSTHSPAWMRQITTASPPKAARTAALLTVINVKVLLISAAAGLAIGTAELGVAGDVAAVVFYTVVGASTVALPVLAYLVAGERLDGRLSTLKVWLERHNVALMAIILVVIGLLLAAKGIQGL